jgi:phage gp29-like protein
MALVDQFGKPISPAYIAALKQEIAEPTAFGSRPPYAGHLAFGINPARLGMLMMAADNGQTRDWFILCEEIEELYPHYTAVLAKRRRQVSLLPITVDAPEGVEIDPKHIDFVRRWLGTGVLEHALFNVLDAIGKGYSASELMWETEPDHIWPSAILWRNQRDFELSWEDGQTLWLRVNAGFVDLAPHKFLVHAHMTKSGGPARSGITRLVAWLWMYATFTMKDWALFVQGYGLPVRLGRYGPEASDQDKRVLWRAVRQISGDLAAIIPRSMEMEFVEAKGTSEGSKLYEGRMDWLNREVSKLVLGGTAGTEAIGGSHAVGQEHRAAEQDVEKFDARLLAGSVNRQIIPAMIAFNFGPQVAYPVVTIGTQEQVPISDVIAAAADLGPLGLKLKAQEIRERLQMTKPAAGDEVIGAPDPVPGAAGPGGDPLAAADLKIKANPHPEINPNSDTRAMLTAQRRVFRRLVAHTAQQRQLLDELGDKVAQEAAGALGGLTGQVRRCFDEADDLADLAQRLQGLKLDDAAFAQAMAAGMALAHLTGQAELLDEIAAGRPSA